MKYIRRFNEDKEKSIEDWCIKFKLGNYTINEDETVDVNDSVSVNLLRNKLVNIPIQFGIINADFYCDYNILISLRGCPKKVPGHFTCSNNKLETLEGGPKEVGSLNDRYILYNCRGNKLISLEGFPEKLVGEFDCSGNPIYEVYKLFDDDYKKYKDSLDYNYLRGTNIIKLRFQEACEEAGITVPESIKGYKYI